MKKNRIDNILKKMKKQNLSQLIISDPGTIFYLTGKWIFPGERLLVLLLDQNGNHKLFINELFPVTEDIGIEKIWLKDTDDGVKIVSQFVPDNCTLGIDKKWPSSFLISLMELKPEAKIVNGSPIVDGVRQIKDAEEKEKMRVASKINDQAVEKVINLVSEGYTEKEMTNKLASIYEELGVTEGFSFEPIIGYGKNAADPHHVTNEDHLSKGDCVVIDIGCIKNSYCSDMTRTVFYGEPSDKAKEVYSIVLEANRRGIAKVKPGVTFAEVDAACRDYINEKGYGKYFTHRTGHSIGIECHEYGDVSSINSNKLKDGMIFSIEPGIYIPGEVGVRIEDLVMVTEGGCEVLNHFSKDMRIIK